MTRTTRLALSLVSLAPLAAACGGGTPPTMSGRTGMLSKTAIAQKCEEAAKGHDRPFIIEWDATDLASFEAFATRDTVVVKYEGCDIQVLDHCSDPGIGGKFGAYGLPTFTSGTVQGFDIANEGELYAKLPLGAASLSGKVSAGESLHLKYFVSGVSTDSRDALYSADLAKYPGCAGATHFVWGYNLGAFELGSSAQNAEEVKAGFGNIGGGGSGSHHEASLANGGSLASCTTNDQRSCKVPIRLVLRAITTGENPNANTAGQQTFVVGGEKMTTAQMQDPSFMQNTPINQAIKLVEEAGKRNRAGDGTACLEMLDRAVTLYPQEASSIGWTHAECQMKAGHCDMGKTELRSEIVKRDPERLKTDEQIAQELDQQANNNCPSSTATSSPQFIIRASRELQDAYKAKDGKRCKTIQSSIEATLPDLTKTRDDMTAHQRAISAGDTAAKCVAETSSCADGYEIYKRNYRLQLPTMKTDMVDKTSAQAWATQIKLGQVKCQ